MAPKDRDLVNFREDYELNRHLRNSGKGQTKENRSTLQAIGDQEKKRLKKTRLTHEEFDGAIKRNLEKLK